MSNFVVRRKDVVGMWTYDTTIEIVPEGKPIPPAIRESLDVVAELFNEQVSEIFEAWEEEPIGS